MTYCLNHTNRTAPSLASSRCQPNSTSPAVAAVAHVRSTWSCHRPRIQPCRAVDIAASLVIGFLPWRGCSQGGFYSTGIEGVHGEKCQAIYQPAAAAEARLTAAQRHPQPAAAAAAAQAAPQLAEGEELKTVSPKVSTEGPAAQSPSAVTSSHTANLALTPVLSTNRDIARESTSSRRRGSTSRVDESSSTTTTSSSSDDVAKTVGTLPHQRVGATSGTAAQQMQQVPESSKDLVREILRGDNRSRTKQLVDDAWQSLE